MVNDSTSNAKKVLVALLLPSLMFVTPVTRSNSQSVVYANSIVKADESSVEGLVDASVMDAVAELNTSNSWMDSIESVNEYVVAKEKERIAEEAKKKAEASAKVTTSTKYNASASDLDVFAAIIQCEGNSSYEARLAVATIIMNRVESSRFPNTIQGVIYAPGQFSPTWSGKLASTIAKGASEACYTAARDAMNGARLESVSNCYFFLAAWSTNRSGVNVGGNLFFTGW